MSVVNVVTLVTKESSGLYTVQSDLHYKVTKDDKDAHFSCEVSYFVPGAVRASESKGVNITVFCKFLSFFFGAVFYLYDAGLMCLQY